MLSRSAESFRLLTPGAVVIARMVPVGLKITCGDAAEGRLFLATEGPAAIREVDWQTGKTLKSWELKFSRAPASIAVCPTRGSAYFTIDHQLHQLDLASGRCGPLKVTPYAIRDGKAERLDAMAAEVLYESERPAARSTAASTSNTLRR